MVGPCCGELNAIGRSGALAILLTLATACSSHGVPTAPTAPTTPTATPSGPVFSAILQPARVYLAAHSSPRPSRYVLYGDGTFVLQYASGPDYRGRYTEQNGIITFDWDGSSRAGPWGATGSIGDDTLSVRYNTIMVLSDFEDGVFVRTQ